MKKILNALKVIVTNNSFTQFYKWLFIPKQEICELCNKNEAFASFENKKICSECVSNYTKGKKD